MLTGLPSLLEASLNGVLNEGSFGVAHLQVLPITLLAQLLQLSVQDKLEAQRQLEEAQARLKHLRQERYICDVPRFAGDAVDESLQRVMAKWEARPCVGNLSSHHGYGNTLKALTYVKELKRFELHKFDDWFAAFTSCSTCGPALDVWAVVSSALLLYRVCCLFPVDVDVEGPDSYKVVWTAELRHRATQEAVGFTEWKGAALVRVSRYDAPPEFEADMLELLNLLCEPHFPHPYKSLEAGAIA